ncbi:MAG: response regulator [Rhodospirillales bacterium]|nr:response regulator [Rhodospirillales bacterium]
MTVYDFDRLSVFLVEDNSYIRNAMEDVLRNIGFGRIMTASNGAEAIDFLKTMHDNPHMTTALGLDLVISDLVMAPVNGLLLLRWLRTAKESPNRMVPFMALSGAADVDYVNAVRDLGANEFLAKPFSVTAVYRRILEVIDYPRQFVATSNYFGPDRRRRKGGRPGGAEDRRTTDESDVAIVYSGDKVKQPKKGDAAVWYFRLPNRLKDKAGGLGHPGAAEIPIDILEKAEESLNRSRLDFAHWAEGYLHELSDLCTQALLKPGRRNVHFEKINLLALELRGQGGTFGYPLITVFGKMLYDVTREGCREDDDMVEIVKAHIDAMRVVLREKITGDGGAVGKELRKSLQKAVGKRVIR